MATIGFIGSGRLGTAFGLYLAENGRQVSGYYNRTLEKARQAVDLFSCPCIAFSSMEELVAQSDWICITTADDALSLVASRLGEAEMMLDGKIVFHMSGALSSDILLPLKRKGAGIASLHPLQSFMDARAGVAALKHTVFSVEGSQEAVDELSTMLKDLNNDYFVITAKQKPLYHAAAAVVSNSMTAVIDYALSLMAAAGIAEEKALVALFPLIDGSLRNVKKNGTAKALTGPIARGDVGTVHKHIKAIDKLAPELLSAYIELGRLTLQTATRGQLTDPVRILQIQQLFEGKGSLE